jgi:hypothetical protein
MDWKIQAESPSNEAGETWREMAVNFADKISISHSAGIFDVPLILRHGADGFTSPPKQGALKIFIARKNPSPSAWTEPGKLGLNYKHATHYATEYDLATNLMTWV